MLVAKSKEITNYVLPVYIITKNGNIKKNWYYDNESLLFKAYYQLKKIDIKNIKPSYPVVY